MELIKKEISLGINAIMTQLLNPGKKRIQSIDLLRGLIMVIMALRSYP